MTFLYKKGEKSNFLDQVSSLTGIFDMLVSFKYTGDTVVATKVPLSFVFEGIELRGSTVAD